MWLSRCQNTDVENDINWNEPKVDYKEGWRFDNSLSSKKQLETATVFSKIWIETEIIEKVLNLRRSMKLKNLEIELKDHSVALND